MNAQTKAQTKARPAARKAAETALADRTYKATLPCGLGTVRIPPPEHLALYGGILALGLFGIVDWPVVLAIGIGHVLADDHHHKVLARFGSALEEA